MSKNGHLDRGLAVDLSVTEGKELHLKDALPDRVTRNQRQPIGKGYLIEVDGLLHYYNHNDDFFLGKRLSEKLRSDQGWFEKLIKNHAPTVGSFYEDTLRQIVDDLLPGKLKSGTGFVFDPVTGNCSSQIDIVVYNDWCEAPIYRRGNFVVLHSKTIVSCSEIKKDVNNKGCKRHYI